MEFPTSSLRAISPDATKLCIEDWKEPGYPLRVVELGTWRTVYTGRFASRTVGADFFADSLTLLVGYPIASQAIVDLTTGNRILRSDSYNPRQHEGDNYGVAADRTLIHRHWESPPSGYETKTLAIVALPDFREVVKVPYATQPRRPRPVRGGMLLNTEGPLVLADNRKALVYSFDNTLVCRRVDDLALLWTTTVEENLEAYKLAVRRMEAGLPQGLPMLNSALSRTSTMSACTMAIRVWKSRACISTARTG
jgi:hypothetical protein